MNIWRFSVEAVAVLMTTAALLCIAAILTTLRARASRSAAKGVFSALLVVALLASPGLVDSLIQRLNTDEGLFIDQGPLVNWGPALFTTGMLFLARAAFPVLSSQWRAWRWRWGFIAAAFFALAVNLMNLCNPGWCATYGLPFPYFSWSDVIIIWNGERSSNFHPIALTLDLCLYAALVYRFAKRYRAGF